MKNDAKDVVKNFAFNFTLLAGFMGAVGVSVAYLGAQQEDAEQALKKHGFTDIKTAYSLSTGAFHCGRGEVFNSYDFTAKNPNGDAVSGYVCQGLFKGSTIRF